MSDVCLILEGTFPYVTGGVSTCVYQLIRETPNINYNLLYIGASKEIQQEYKYPIPSNVKLIKEIFLYDYEIEGKVKQIDASFNPEILKEFHSKLKTQDVSIFDDLFNLFFNPKTRICDPFDVLESKQAWEFLMYTYKSKFPDGNGPSFIDFFYNWRFTHFPLFRVLSTEIPRANLYHSLCTGYAGVVGAAAKLMYNKPYVLTEHGIYSHEREIEIYQADWIHNTDKDVQAKQNHGIFKEWWIKIFHFLAQVAYEKADSITTLHNGNKLKQMKYGAPEEKIEIIPNGIDINKFSNVQHESDKEFVEIALIGRVVPIKDIKTFIKSINIVSGKIKNLKVHIMGPTDEDEEYFADCQRLVQLLDLGDVINFTGKVNIFDYLNRLDCLVLSSISEGQPMVILEGFAAKIPSVATDVGSCHELIYGGDAMDKDIGAAGAVVPFGKPDELGRAILSVVEDEEKRKKMGENGFKRVNRLYREDQTIQNYLNVYNRYLSRSY